MPQLDQWWCAVATAKDFNDYLRNRGTLWYRRVKEARQDRSQTTLQDFDATLRALPDKTTAPNRIPFLWSWHKDKRISAAELRTLLTDHWYDSQCPVLTWGNEKITPLFRSTGFLSDTDAPQPTDKLTLYRGCIASAPLDSHMSWSRDRDVAEWFTREKCEITRVTGIKRTILTTEVEAKYVLATFDREGQAEVVIDPCGLSAKTVAGIPIRIATWP